MQNLKNNLKKTESLVERFLDEYMGLFEACPKLLKNAMEYSLYAGGKRVRPVLMIWTYQGMGNNDLRTVMPFACGIEMIHTYSLIHDDLPAMDNDEYRRGKKTNHIVFGEDIAILAGDALLNGAFELMTRNIQSQQTIKAMQIITQAAGCTGMIGGQVYDIQKATDEESLLKIHALKTGKLIEASVMVGGVLSGANTLVLKTLSQYAQKLGMAFQIKDDILDVIGDKKKLGKEIGSDEKNKKLTYVSLYGMDKAKQLLMQYTNESVDLIESLPKDLNKLALLAKELGAREF